MCVVANFLMHPIRSIYDVVGWVRPARVPPLSFLYMAIQQLGIGCCPYANCFLHDQLHSSAGMLQYPSVTPANGTVLSPGMFGYSRLAREAFDVCVLMLLQMCFKSTCSLANVERRVGLVLNTTLMLKSLHTFLIRSLTPAT